MPPEAAIAEAPAAAAPDVPQSATVEAPFNDAFSDLDKMINPSEATPKEAAKDAPNDDKSKADKTVPEDSKPAKTTEDKPKLETEAKADAVKSDESKAPETKRPSPWQLVHKYEADLTQARARIKELESGSPSDHPEVKALSEKASAATKRAEELENRMRFVSYKDSGEFKEKYEKPYVDAWIAGRAKVASMNVSDAESGAVRRASPEDFDAIMAIRDDGIAADKAAELFGAKSAVVLYHRERVQELSSVADKALEEYRTKGSEMEKQARETHENFIKVVTGEIAPLWKQFTEASAKKYPQWSKPVDGDEKGTQLLEAGMQLAQQAFASFDVYNPKLTKEQRVDMIQKHAAVFNKAAWFDRLAYQSAQQVRRIKELEAKVKEYASSEPPAGTGKSPKDKNVQATWEQQLEATAV